MSQRVPIIHNKRCITHNNYSSSTTLAIILLVIVAIFVVAVLLLYANSFTVEGGVVDVVFIPEEESLIVLKGPDFTDTQWNDLQFKIRGIDAKLYSGYLGSIKAGQQLDLETMICPYKTSLSGETFKLDIIETSKNVMVGTYTLPVPDCSSHSHTSGSSGTPSDPWCYPYTDWGYRKVIIINHTKVSADEHNFPVLIHVTDGDLKDHVEVDGRDIAFILPDGTTKLYHEIEEYDPVTGELIAWVNIPAISAHEDTIFYMYYGNSFCSDQQNPQALWGPNYILVHHLEESSGAPSDSTQYSSDGSLYGGVTQNVAGRIGPAYQFDGVDGCIRIEDSGTILDFDNTQPYTWSLWFNFDDFPVVPGYDPVNRQGFLSKDAAPAYKAEGFNHILVQDGSNADYVICKPGHCVYDPVSGITTCESYEDSSILNQDLHDHTWVYYVIVYDGAGNWQVYNNGVFQNTINFNVESDDNAPYFIGAATWPWDGDIEYSIPDPDPWLYFDGRIDEIRVSQTIRSQTWIGTSFNSMNAPHTFLTIGPEEIQ